jgi:hypothetical protein
MNISTADIENLEAENRRRHFMLVADSFDSKANDPDLRISEIEREYFRSEATRCRDIAKLQLDSPM